jgi:hypothetical protein
VVGTTWSKLRDGQKWVVHSLLLRSGIESRYPGSPLFGPVSSLGAAVVNGGPFEWFIANTTETPQSIGQHYSRAVGRASISSAHDPVAGNQHAVQL